MATDYKALGKRISNARKQAGITQEALGEQLNMTRKHISVIESAIKGSKTAKGHTASCSVVLGCFATYWVAKGNSCYLMGSSQNATNAL